ncbi:MAG: Ig-like domain-containing protein [Clostridia bacterium]|nr:Ig-like domain-containing protein [Clostridia bacterium]
MENVEISERKRKQTKILYIAVIVVLCLMFVVGFFWGLDRVLALEGTFPPAALKEGLTPAPVSGQDACDFLNASVEKALADRPKATRSESIGIDGDSIQTDLSDRVLATLKLVRGSVEDKLNDGFESQSVGFSEDFTPYFASADLQPADVQEMDVDYIYYQCRNCGAESDEQPERCDACDYPYPYLQHYRDNYTVTLTLATDSALHKDVFKPLSKKEAVALIAPELKDVCDVKDIDVTYNELTVNYCVRRMTNELQWLSYNKTMTVTVKVAFTGAYAALGEGSFTADLTRRQKYDFTWPGLSLNKHTANVEPKASDNLLATLTCDDPAKMAVTWTSSDPNILTVDEDGYYKGLLEGGRATITASFEFNGKTYSDSCDVTVGYAVEGSKLSHRKATLATGDTLPLEVKINPAKATIRTVTWYTTDETVATVNAEGVVTAVGNGQCEIYSLTDDGFYKSTCEVTVQ